MLQPLASHACLLKPTSRHLLTPPVLPTPRRRLNLATLQVQACAVSVWHLQRVLAKKRDPVTHSLFLDESLPPGPAAALPCERFWVALVHGLAEQLGKSFQAAGFVRDTLTAAFPRFASLLEATFAKMVQEGETRDKLSPPLVARGVTSADLLRIAEPFQNAYLAKSLARLSEAANAAFPQGGRGSPAPQDVQGFVGRIREEVASAASNAALCALVVSGVGKAVKLFSENCEYSIVSVRLHQHHAEASRCRMRVLLTRLHFPFLRDCALFRANRLVLYSADRASLSPGLLVLPVRFASRDQQGPDAKQVAGPCNPAQAKNLSTVTQLESLKLAIAQLSTSLPPSASTALASSLDALQTVAVEALTPLFRAISDKLEHIVVAMHSEPWGEEAATGSGAGGAGGSTPTASGGGGGGRGPAGSKAVSPYMVDLGKFLAHVHSEFLTRLSPAASWSADLPSRRADRGTNSVRA